MAQLDCNVILNSSDSPKPHCHYVQRSYKVLYIGIFIILLIILLVGGWWAIMQSDQEARTNLLQLTRQIAHELELSQIKRLTGTEHDINSPIYLRIKEQLCAIRYANPLCRFVYLIGRKADGTVFCYADSEPVGLKDYSPPGQIYNEVSIDCYRVFDTKQAMVEGPISDRWGTWVSGLAPIIDKKKGAVTAVLGMDIDVLVWKWNLILSVIPYCFFILVMVAIMVVFCLKQSQKKTWPNIETRMTAAVGVILTLAIAWLANTNENRRYRDAFSSLAISQAKHISEVFHDLSQTKLESIAHYFERNEGVSKTEFEQFVSFLSENSEIRAWEWVPVISEEKRKNFEEDICETEMSEFKIWQKDESGNKIPISEPRTVYPVLFISPFAGNERALGYDLGSEPVRLAAIIKAEQTGLTTGTDAITLVQETASQKGMLVFRPVFENSDSGRLRGLVLAVLRMGSILENASLNDVGSGLEMELFELYPNKPSEMLASTQKEQKKRKSPFIFNFPIFAFGKTFLLTTSPSEAFESLHPGRLGFITVFAGLMITVVIAFAVDLVANRKRELELQVAERTNTLKDSEIKIHLLLNSTAEAIYGLDLNGNCTFCNNSCLQILGYMHPEQLIGKNMHIQIHSKRSDGTFFHGGECRICEVFKKGEGIHVDDEVFWRADGTCFPVAYRAYPQFRDDEVVGIVVTFLDITERKRTEDQMQQLLHLQQLLMNISTTYINLPITEIESAIQVALGDIASFVKADRSYLFSYDFGQSTCTNTYEWCKEGIEPQIDKLQAVPLEDITDWVTTHRGGESVYIPDVLSLPDGRLRGILEPQGIKSLLTVPLMSEGESIGFVGFDYIQQPHAYSENERGLLMVFAQLLVNIQRRQRTEILLRESESNFRTFFESMTDMIMVGTPNGRLLFTNTAVVQTLGYTSEELKGMHLLDVHPAENRQEAEDVFTAMFEGKQEKCPLPVISKSGILIPVETRVWFGRWNGEDCIFGISKNLTAEQDAQQRFERLFRNNPALMAISNLPDRRFLDVNNAFLETLGYSRDELIGHNSQEIALFVHPQQQAAVADELREKGRISGLELQVRHKDGTIFEGLFSGEIIISQGKQYFLTVMIDITERKQAEKALQQAHDTLEQQVTQRTSDLKQSHQQLRLLYMRLQSAQESERKQISREIHDELGTVLTVLKYDLIWISGKVHNSSEEITEKVKAMSDTIDRIIKTVQNICTQLRPGLLDDMGLAAAIEWQAKQYAKTARFRCKLDLDEEINLGQDYSTTLYRVCQELLTNIARHSQATTIQISLKKQDNKVYLKVQDNGIGISEEQVSDAKSLGLIGIRERVSILDGSFEIKGSTGKGTIVKVLIPIEKKG